MRLARADRAAAAHPAQAGQLEAGGDRRAPHLVARVVRRSRLQPDDGVRHLQAGAQEGARVDAVGHRILRDDVRHRLRAELVAPQAVDQIQRRRQQADEPARGEAHVVISLDRAQRADAEVERQRDLQQVVERHVGRQILGGAVDREPAPVVEAGGQLGGVAHAGNRHRLPFTGLLLRLLDDGQLGDLLGRLRRVFDVAGALGRQHPPRQRVRRGGDGHEVGGLHLARAVPPLGHERRQHVVDR